MNFKTLVFVALIATATIADDTFLADAELERMLVDYTTTQVPSTVCTKDSDCSAYFSGLTGCCAKWYRSISTSTTTTSLGSYCTPLVLVGSNNWFTYASYNYSATACTIAANTPSALWGSCTSGSNSACNTTANQTCVTYSWANGTASSPWTASSSLGSYCQYYNSTADIYAGESNSWLIQYK